MSDAEVVPGSRWRARATIGKTTADADTRGVIAPLRAGTDVAVRELVPAGVQGAHDDSADAVVVEWVEPDILVHDAGRREPGGSPRAVAVPVGEFTSLFEPVEG